MRPYFLEMFRFYAEHHQQFFNQMTHVIGIPFIILSLQMVLSLVPVFSLNLAWINLIAVMIFYVYVDWRLALVSLVYLLLLTLLAQWISLQLSTVQTLMIGGSMFVLSWILPFVGHFVEGRPPALFSNILQVLIAPIFLSAELCFLFGYRQDLKSTLKHK